MLYLGPIIEVKPRKKIIKQITKYCPNSEKHYVDHGRQKYCGYCGYCGVKLCEKIEERDMYESIGEINGFSNDKRLTSTWYEQYKNIDTRSNSFIIPCYALLDKKLLKFVYYSNSKYDLQLFDNLQIKNIIDLFENVYVKEISTLKELDLFVAIHYGYMLYSYDD